MNQHSSFTHFTPQLSQFLPFLKFSLSHHLFPARPRQNLPVADERTTHTAQGLNQRRLKRDLKSG